MFHKFDVESMVGVSCKVHNGHKYIQLPGGPQIHCASYADARLLSDLINKLAVSFEDAKQVAK